MIFTAPDETLPPQPTVESTPEPTPPVEVVECPSGHCPTPAPAYTTPGFPDEDGDGCAPGLTPNPDFIKGVTEACITPTPPAQLAETGVIDVLLPLGLLAAVLVAAGAHLIRHTLRGGDAA